MSTIRPRRLDPSPQEAVAPIGEGPTGAFIDYWLGRRPDLDGGALAGALILARLSLLNQKAVARAAQSSGVTGPDYSLLAVIQRGRGEDAVRPSDLSRLFALPPSVVTYRISHLVERGLVRRAAKAGDRRAILLHLTSAGERVVGEVMGEVAGGMDERMAALDAFPHGRQALLDLLGALVEGWERLDEAAGD